MWMEKYTQTACLFAQEIHSTTFSTKQIVALWSVNKFFPKSYDFTSKLIDTLLFYVPFKNISLIWRSQHYL
jgi:hypothetical protein